MTEEFKHLYDTLLLRPGNSVYNDDYRKFIQESKIFDNWFSSEFDMDCQEEFLEYYPKWIESSKLNNFSGLESYPYRFISLGVTQSLDEFFYEMATENRRIRMFKGEYPYSRDVIVDWDWDRDFIENRQLQENEAVIISAPFSATGNIHPKFNWLLDECYKLNNPVFVDCAFFGTCGNIIINLNHSAIRSVAFSTTKGVQCGDFRAGIKFTKKNSGSIKIQTDWHHGIHLNVCISLYLMKQFSPDYNYKKYRKAQERVCKYFNLESTRCIQFGIGGKGWEYFSRDGVVNRIALKEVIKKEMKNE